MTEYESILRLSQDDKVELSESFKELIGKELCFGETRYMVRHGVLSEGHLRLTPAQRYYASIKEMWVAGQSIRRNKATAMIAQADLLEAQEQLETAEKPSQKMRWEGKSLQAKETILDCLVSIQDTTRKLDELNKIRLELQPEVQSKYPEGIEQSEKDNWKVVAEHQAMISPQPLSWIPLEREEKAKLGLKYKRTDLMAWDAVMKSLEGKQDQRELSHGEKLLSPIRNIGSS